MADATEIGTGAHSAGRDGLSERIDVRLPQGPSLAEGLACRDGSGRDAAQDQPITLNAQFWEKRDRDLNNCLPLWPHQLERNVGAVAALIVTLERSDRKMREEGQAGRWNYSYPRHCSLKTILKRERALLRRLTSEASQ